VLAVQVDRRRVVRTYAESDAAAIAGSPFSNSDEGIAWMANWCDRCVHDRPARRGDDGNGCHLILIALCGKTPSEWMEGPRDEKGRYSMADQYHCIEFRDERDRGGREPRSPRPVPGQGELIPRDGLEGTRMFVDVVNEATRELEDARP
jgi:hypothetical protein